MSFAATVTQFSFPLLALADLLRGALVLALLGCVLMFFRPLLSGLLRAFVLTLRPRPARPARNARA
ncbi:hypothetical protein [Massilia sp. Leaf139]|uniref:hypothetical protein n=1 Tax=Massilia sp. Leaf139 TaxID=1736272 RepID=UPI0006FC8419|nr:hypothetical protein [Massilia sp. Leaf139]KQQ88416.1 hypothetical protein ASF77_12150 [Massilia sp. Leaf139]